ncbi:hypothetical protein MTO96_021379 [Rhipicephalus appendiculatus]
MAIFPTVAGCDAFNLFSLHLTLGTAQETNDVPDSFKIFETFPFAVAISDADNDTVYECLTAKRMWLEPEEKKGEYIWFLKGNLDNRKRTVSFYVFEGPSPDTFLFTVGSDEALSSEAKFHYTDYEKLRCSGPSVQRTPMHAVEHGRKQRTRYPRNAWMNEVAEW